MVNKPLFFLSFFLLFLSVYIAFIAYSLIPTVFNVNAPQNEFTEQVNTTATNYAAVSIIPLILIICIIIAIVFALSGGVLMGRAV